VEGPLIAGEEVNYRFVILGKMHWNELRLHDDQYGSLLRIDQSMVTNLEVVGTWNDNFGAAPADIVRVAGGVVEEIKRGKG
jgi:hypothetical protein